MVNRFAQVRGRCIRIKIRPQDVHRLLAMEPVSRRQRKQLHETGRLPAPPLVLRNDTVSDRNPKAPEQLDPQRHRRWFRHWTTIPGA
jgi:hypothetical protein